MTFQEQQRAAKAFAEYWKGKGYEKGETQPFWIELLRTVFGVSNPEHFIVFENQVELEHTNFIDARIPSTEVLIEQKSLGVNLETKQKQSDGAMLTPMEQAKRYIFGLKRSEFPRFVVVCNFETFQVYDTEERKTDYIQLSDLPKEFHRLQFLVDATSESIKREMELSMQAGELVGTLYDAILKLYIDPTADSTLKSLNKLCVRLVFCLYAEDAGIFPIKNQFHDYLAKLEPSRIRGALIDLFKVLDTKTEERDPYLNDDLAAFPYVNGGLFAEENIEIPRINDEVKNLLIAKASDDFDWSDISPTIFGAVFESTLNPETRRSGGMHYTSIENIHKVIDPLFLDELRQKLNDTLKLKDVRERTKRLRSFQEELASLTFLDPACGSGNFLTETFLSLRRLENEAIKAIHGDGAAFLGEALSPVLISIDHFYGIEINDFAVAVAKTALWIAESQMLRETEEIVGHDIDFLPLKTNASIIEENALKLDWNTVVPKERLNYIMGNPPFVGYSFQSNEQKAEMLSIYKDEKGKPYKTAGKIDYVAGWYFKAAEMMQSTSIRTAFVSTNSITQGEQVASVWKPLYERFGVHIDFAHRTFRWDSEASIKAHVHCVIIGFSIIASNSEKVIFDENGNRLIASEISPYLIDAPTVFVENRNKPLCDVPTMTTGNRPADGGHLIIEEKDYNDFITKEPDAKQYIKKLIGSEEFINNKKRYCLWLVNISPAELRKMPLVMNRVELCRKDRLNSPDAGRRKLAERPTVFRETLNPDSFIIVPSVSSEKRQYVPIGFMGDDTISTNLNIIIPDATLYHFGVLTSSVHMDWMRAVCGRLETRYRYSINIVYNNFPWPEASDEQKKAIEETAQGILDARNQYPDCSLADLYDENTMPPELRKAHQANDLAVMKLYGYKSSMTEPAIVADLMKRYQQLMSSSDKM
ncbi:MAG: class I SAM-dependent DNA methyltransferase [Lentisphaeria bacterium]|nr:class I SAM-dependent DNA methyltransferase [Lentisphaeria bacterium]